MSSSIHGLDKYMNSLDEDKKEVITQLDKQIRSIVNVEPKLWSQKLWGGTDQNIIGYGEYSHTYSSGKKVHWFLVGLAAQKNYFSVYINAVENKQYLPETRKEELGKVKVGKSCINFKKISDINLDVLLELVIRAFKINAG